MSELCPMVWPLLDPNDEDLEAGRSHHCVRANDHDGDHRCSCGLEKGHGVGFVIGAVWAFVAVHDDGDEGIIGAAIGPGGSMMPFVAADKARVDDLRPLAVEMAKLTGKRVRLVRFDTRTDEEVIEP